MNEPDKKDFYSNECEKYNSNLEDYIKSPQKKELVDKSLSKKESISKHSDIDEDDTTNHDISVTVVQNNFNSNTTDSNEPFYKESVKYESIKEKKANFRRNAILLCTCTILGGSFLGFGLGVGSSFMNNFILSLVDSDKSGDSLQLIPKETANLMDDSDFSIENIQVIEYKSYSEIVQKVKPSVVSINSTIASKSNNIFNQQNYNPGSGSGILFYESDYKYYIATNYHVIENATDISVSVSGSEPISANIAGIDSTNDLSVLYVNKKDARSANIEEVTLASFGNSDDMEVGDLVLAMGNALGEGVITTNGIISAQARNIAVNSNLHLVMLQTNAAINPGNSGGPLVNLNGEVIGINTAKVIESRSEGIGYSIPSNIAKPILQGFIDSMSKPYMGITKETISHEYARQFNLPYAGVLVTSVLEGSPAMSAGIEPNDLITGFAGEPIFNSEDLSEAINKCSVGETVEVKIIRDGKESVNLKVTLEQRL